MNKTPPDAALDAYEPDAVSCGTGQMVCNGACEDVMTSDLHCGGCDTQCVPAQGCAAGTCVSRSDTCAHIKLFNPNAADGMYFTDQVSSAGTFYCDFANNKMYEDFAITGFQVTPPAGYVVARATDFQDTGFQKAFITWYNYYGGTRVMTSWTESNCCMGPVAGQRYMFGAQILFTGQGTSQLCNQNPFTAGIFLTFGRNGTGYTTTLPADYFTQFPATEGAACGDGNNAAWFFKRRDGLE